MPITYIHGLDVVSGAAGRSISVQIDNAAELAEKSSALAGLVGQYAPDTVDQLVYEEVASQIKAALDARGVKSAVVVGEPKKSVPDGWFRDGFRDAIVAMLGGLGAGLGVWWITRRGK